MFKKLFKEMFVSAYTYIIVQSPERLAPLGIMGAWNPPYITAIPWGLGEASIEPQLWREAVTSQSSDYKSSNQPKQKISQNILRAKFHEGFKV